MVLGQFWPKIGPEVFSSTGKGNLVQNSGSIFLFVGGAFLTPAVAFALMRRDHGLRRKEYQGLHPSLELPQRQ